VIQTPLYTAIIQEGTISTETEAKIAEEIIRIHTTVMTVPKNLVRIPSALLSHGRFLQVEGLLQNMDNDISLKAFDVMPLAQSMTWKFDRTIFTEIWQGLS
jgi:C4-type Zn-finger protein